MAYYLNEVRSISELKQFIRFPMGLYRDNEFYVPPLMDFELSTLDRKKNPAFDHADARYWVVKDETNKIVGRVAGIILNAELEKEGKVRFGWIDFIDDFEVSKLLLNSVTAWGKEKGATRLHGPMGFTDIDFEGSLIEGFDFMATQATIYNYPYYNDHYERYRLNKAVDWVERRGLAPDKFSDRLPRINRIVREKYGFKSLDAKKKKTLKAYAPEIFELLNTTYSDLYGYYPLSKKQIDYYTDQYFGFIRKDFVSIVLDEQDNIAGMAICIPSISRGLRKAKGRLFPFGFIHILRDFYSNHTMDLFLIGVLPKYQKSGVNAVVLHDIVAGLIKNKVRFTATGPMLEGNTNVQNLWKEFSEITDNQIKRRCYIKNI